MLDQLRERLHLWIVSVNGPLDTAWATHNEPILSDEERDRHRRYRRARDRDLFLVSHVAARQVLSCYFPIEAGEWSFETNQYGRPEIVSPGAPRGLRFNLSHTDGMIALLIHDGLDSGVDVERIGRIDDLRGVSKTVFAGPERTEFLSLPNEQQEERFYRLWTMKEAFIKAKGMGLALPLNDFWFESENEGKFRFSCVEDVEQDPAAWHFTLHRPSPHHIIATACRSGSDRPAREVEVFEIAV